MVRQPVTVGVAAAVGVAALAVVDARTTSVPLCPLKAITGLDCPFCGGLRAVSALTRFDLAGALDHNVLFTASIPLLVVGWALWMATALRGTAPWRPAPWLARGGLAVLVVFAVARNLPAYPWLASGA